MHNIVPLGIDINGLSSADQTRIRAVGLSRWMDELASRPRAGKAKPSRYSLEYRQAQMKKRLSRQV